MCMLIFHILTSDRFVYFSYHRGMLFFHIFIYCPQITLVSMKNLTLLRLDWVWHSLFIYFFFLNPKTCRNLRALYGMHNSWLLIKNNNNNSVVLVIMDRLVLVAFHKFYAVLLPFTKTFRWCLMGIYGKYVEAIESGRGNRNDGGI